MRGVQSDTKENQDISFYENIFWCNLIYLYNSFELLYNIVFMQISILYMIICKS